MLRFAPSPTSDMHIGDLRVALFNYIVSKQKKEEFIIRIEDIDKEKNIDGKDTEILDLLNLFGIEYSQVIYQSENIRFHSAMALQLIHDKKAFSCFCSDEWLDKKRQEAKDNKKAYRYDDACRNLPDELVIDNTAPFTIRINKPNSSILIKDYIKGNVTFNSDAIDSFEILHQNKTPLSNFASAVDDMLSDISIVIREEDNINNSLKQEHIREQLNYDKKIKFVHLPIILNDNNEKISKYDDTLNVKWLLKEGFLPEAIVNYLLLIGNRSIEDIFNINDAIEWLDLNDISNSPTHFSLNILKDINRKHLKNLNAKELSRYVGFADESIGELAKVYLEEETATTKELRNKIEAIFATKTISNSFATETKLLTKIIKEAPYFEKYIEFENYLIKESNLKKENLLIPIRLLLTGAENGPNISDIYTHIKNYIGEIVK